MEPLRRVGHVGGLMGDGCFSISAVLQCAFPLPWTFVAEAV